MGKKGKGKGKKGKKGKVAPAPDPRVLPLNIRAACLSGDISTVEAWLSGGGNADATHSNFQTLDRGRTLLMLAARTGQVCFVDLLIQRRASINYQGLGGATAVMFAACQGGAAVMKRLLWWGADVRLANFAGEGALQWSQARGDDACVRLIKDHDKDWYKPLQESSPTAALGVPPGLLAVRAASPPRLSASQPLIWAGVTR